MKRSVFGAICLCCFSDFVLFREKLYLLNVSSYSHVTKQTASKSMINRTQHFSCFYVTLNWVQTARTFFHGYSLRIGAYPRPWGFDAIEQAGWLPASQVTTLPRFPPNHNEIDDQTRCVAPRLSSFKTIFIIRLLTRICYILFSCVRRLKMKNHHHFMKKIYILAFKKLRT